ncbi:MAG: sigma-70 family RNA polymerase sigma factor [Oscillospiraceae bacterium]|jgi:RNA polymerase sigma-70 factor (ECF subfamily)|nr:sigma-70 family RNA polymerase sigma factor [Oscillospiraceae bacterium]
MFVFHTLALGDKAEDDIIAERYEEVRLKCLHLASRILGDQALAEDALHDAFAAVIVHREKYQSLPPEEFFRVIAVIVKGKCIDILRKNGRAELISTDEMDELPADKSANTEALALGELSLGRMTEYLEALDDISRQILLMKYVQKLSYTEIAETLGIKEKTVEVRIARAKQKIREQAPTKKTPPAAKGE